MTTLDLDLNPVLERWIDDVVRRQLEPRLRDVLECAAEVIYDRVRQLSSAAYGAATDVRDLTRADEVHEPAAQAIDPTVRSLGFAVAEALARAADTVDPASLRLRVAAGPAVAPEEMAGLPSTLPELREHSHSTSEAAARLGVNSSRVRQRLLARTLYGFKDGAIWWVPDFQFENGGTVPGIERVFPEIRPAASSVAVARWFLLPWADLVVDEERETVVSPRAWLLEGRDPAPVVAQARVL